MNELTVPLQPNRIACLCVDPLEASVRPLLELLRTFPALAASPDTIVANSEFTSIPVLSDRYE